MGSDEALNRIAVVYVGQEEYRVSASAKAEGPAIEWLDHAFVRQPDPTTFGSEIEVSNEVAKHILKQVREELEKQPAIAPAEAKAAAAFDPNTTVVFKISRSRKANSSPARRPQNTGCSGRI